MTPYLRSRLPRQEEIDRLKSLGRKIYATCLHSEIKLDRPPDRQRQMQRNRTKPITAFSVARDTGHVRLRKRTGEAWQVKLFGSAVAICE